MVITTLIVLLLIGALACVGGVFLQLYLSKKENKLLGLVLPGVTFLYSLARVLSMSIAMPLDTWADVGLLLRSFLLLNLPTLVLLVIYWLCKDSTKRNKQLEKMNIQDL